MGKRESQCKMPAELNPSDFLRNLPRGATELSARGYTWGTNDPWFHPPLVTRGPVGATSPALPSRLPWHLEKPHGRKQEVWTVGLRPGAGRFHLPQAGQRLREQVTSAGTAAQGGQEKRVCRAHRTFWGRQVGPHRNNGGAQVR